MSFGQMNLKCRCLAIMHSTTFSLKHLVPVPGGIVWGSFAATGPAHLALIALDTNSSVYQSPQESNVKLIVQQLKLG